AAAYLKVGRAADALAIADAACAAVGETGARMFEGELHRIAGEAAAHGAGSSTDAEARLRRALDVTRRPGGLALPLRAPTSLAPARRPPPSRARFGTSPGAAPGGRALRPPLSARFTEGLAPPALVGAGAVLDELGGGASRPGPTSSTRSAPPPGSPRPATAAR